MTSKEQIEKKGSSSSSSSSDKSTVSLDKHKRFISNYLYFHGTPEQKQKYDYRGYRSDHQVLRDNHQFIRDDEEDANDQENWEKQLAKKYYDRLFKEYAIIDLSQYKTGQIGLRWRVEAEVISGKGQFMCANVKCTCNDDSLNSYEVPFTYIESKVEKSALVKVMLCYPCSKLLHYTNIKKKKKELKRLLKKRQLEDNDQEEELELGNDGNNNNDDDDTIPQSIKKQKNNNGNDEEEEEEYIEKDITTSTTTTNDRSK
ncbi:hypothetical protein DFA_05691 [Cavenderia fasciculata]|uniref:Protein FRA10AC1 homolog n=1 Tax=Cavenderia fasciculata TaxID=261658 RepID=F4PM58_CACFS|nr:uncharacterized protein DFA_05691 [Cavenderia fasciculata]EGG23558.1 hypothetical protein DFA_05691 [Cavenderia fasciculata]|eukprot:XP_004361409.1 hypothetical protein DFA_05691 [Cavenderia fasciculata]